MPINRRSFLWQAGGGFASLALLDLLSRDAKAATASPLAAKPPHFPVKAKHCVFLFMNGAPSHIDTFDPKPDAPVQIRGEFGTIATRTPGLRLCEHLPALAALSDRYSLIRSMTQSQREHEPCSHMMLAGLDKTPPGATERANRATDWPNLGSVLAYARPSPPEIPTAIVLPTKLTFMGYSFPGQNAGFLGARYDPWHLEGDPSAPDFRPPALSLPEGLSLSRVGTRSNLLATVEANLGCRFSSSDSM